MGFAIIGSLAPRRRPHIRFLFIGSRLCSTLLSGPPGGECYFTLALRYDFTCIRLSQGLSPLGCRDLLGTHRTGLAVDGEALQLVEIRH
jgi:hypothetical protein